MEELEWTAPYFKSRTCKRIFFFSPLCITVPHANIVCPVCCSGTTIPNGTDKDHMGTPENEGKWLSSFTSRTTEHNGCRICMNLPLLTLDPEL